MKFKTIGFFLLLLGLFACDNRKADRKILDKKETLIQQRSDLIHNSNIDSQTPQNVEKKDSVILKWLSGLTINTVDSVQRKIHEVIIREVYGFDKTEYDSNYLLQNNIEAIEGLYVSNSVTYESEKHIVISFEKELRFIEEFSFVFDKSSGEVKQFLELFETEINKQKFVKEYELKWEALKSTALNKVKKMADEEEGEDYKNELLWIYEKIHFCTPLHKSTKFMIKNNRLKIIGNCENQRINEMFEFSPNLEFELELIKGLII